jgi:arylsulfatase A-like enzyme
MMTETVSPPLFPPFHKLGMSDVGWMDETIISPRINELATNGVRLFSHYAWHWCAPSRGALMTGRDAPMTGYLESSSGPGFIDGNPLPLKWDILPQQLQSAGYKTYGIGKYHLGFPTPEYTPENRGFDGFFGFAHAGENYWTKEIPTGGCPARDFWKDGANVVDENVFQSPTDELRPEVYETTLFTDYVVNIVTEHDFNSAPLFLYLAYNEPHVAIGDGFQVPREFFELYDDPFCSFTTNPDDLRNDMVCGGSDYRQMGNCYCNRLVKKAKITALDTSIGRVHDALDDRDQLDNTVIVFFGDNGGDSVNGASNWPFRGGKFTQFEGGVRVPTFVWSPLLDSSPLQGGWYNETTSITDWLPTFMGLAGVDSTDLREDQITGVSVWDSLLTGAGSHREDVLIGKGVLRMGAYKLFIENPAGRNGADVVATGVRDCLLFSEHNGLFPPVTEYNDNLPVCIRTLYENGDLNDGLSCSDAVEEWDVWMCAGACTLESPCLYNVETDVGEEFNLAEDPQYAELIAEMTARLEDYQSRFWVQEETPWEENREEYCEQVASNGGYAAPWFTCPGGGTKEICDARCNTIQFEDNVQGCLSECTELCGGSSNGDDGITDVAIAGIVLGVGAAVGLAAGAVAGSRKPTKTEEEALLG